MHVTNGPISKDRMLLRSYELHMQKVKFKEVSFIVINNSFHKPEDSERVFLLVTSSFIDHIHEGTRQEPTNAQRHKM